MKDEIESVAGADRRRLDWTDRKPADTGPQAGPSSLLSVVSEWLRRRMGSSETCDAARHKTQEHAVQQSVRDVIHEPEAPSVGMDQVRVLYAESNFVRAQFFAELLRIEGVLPDIALSGPDVIARAEETAYGLVLLETGLSKGSLAAARAIREIEGRTRRPRSMIICFSSTTPAASLPILDTADIDAYTAGPLRLEHVLPAIGRDASR